MLRRDFDLDADLADVARMNDWLHALARDAGMADRLRDDLKLCLNEAVANVIMYGTAPDGPPDIRLTVEASPTGARAILTDTAQAFDPLGRPEAGKMTGIDTARIGGFGISLIRATAQHLTYARDAGRNCLTIVCGTP